MGEQWGGCKVQCPFYRSHCGNQIRCESLFDIKDRDGCTTATFHNEKRRKDHMNMYCKSAYKDCRLCCALMKLKYPETGK